MRRASFTENSSQIDEKVEERVAVAMNELSGGIVPGASEALLLWVFECCYDKWLYGQEEGFDRACARVGDV